MFLISVLHHTKVGFQCHEHVHKSFVVFAKMLASRGGQAAAWHQRCKDPVENSPINSHGAQAYHDGPMEERQKADQ